MVSGPRGKIKSHWPRDITLTVTNDPIGKQAKTDRHPYRLCLVYRIGVKCAGSGQGAARKDEDHTELHQNNDDRMTHYLFCACAVWRTRGRTSCRRYRDIITTATRTIVTVTKYTSRTHGGLSPP